MSLFTSLHLIVLAPLSQLKGCQNGPMLSLQRTTMILTYSNVSMSHRRNHYAVVLTTGSSPDQDVNAVIKVHMEIMFAQKCLHDSNIHPRYATL